MRGTYRDKVVESVCNFLLNHVATKEYRAFVTIVNRMGKEAVDKMVEGWAREEKVNE